MPTKKLYHNREISTLSFNERVLQEAEDARNPLMERLRFLGIFSSNMDEFYKVRVASIHRQIEMGYEHLSQLVELIGEKTKELDDRFRAAYNAIIDGLGREGIRLLTETDVDELPEDSQQWLREYFLEEVLPSLVPIIVDERREFPQLIDGALYFAIKMDGAEPRYAILQIPTERRRFVELPSGDIMYVDDVIRRYLDDVFYLFDYDNIEAYEFKISRDAELDMDNDFSDDYVRRMEQELKQRKGGRPTRLVHDEAIPPVMLKILERELKLSEDDPRIGGSRYHNMKDLMRFPHRRADLTYPELEPAPHPILDFDKRPIVKTIEDRDVLVTYPYQSIDHVLRLLREAAIDPDVEAIKMTLYRVADNSQVVNALINAAWNGKRVFVCIELQARFDEKRNINIAAELLEVGATVVYGIPPMKVHCKLLLIERAGKRLAGVSTGNFNETTGKLYIDSTLFTGDSQIAAEVDDAFRFLERASRMRMLTPPTFKHLLISPINLRKRVTKLIDHQIKKGSKGYIFIKVNHITDEKMTKKLLDAADAGVQVDLIVRTTYTMKQHPNIRAISILDRFLEHQRVYIFGKGPERQIYLSSADLMERNLDWRMEAAVVIKDPAVQQEILDMMKFQRNDTLKARLLDSRQSNQYVDVNGNGYGGQERTYRYFQNKGLAPAEVATK